VSGSGDIAPAVAITIPLGVRLLRDSGDPIYPVSTLTGLRVIADTAALLAALPSWPSLSAPSCGPAPARSRSA